MRPLLRRDCPKEEKAREAEEATVEYNAALEAFCERLENPDNHDDLMSDAIEFVKKLELPYPWLAMELVERSVYAITGFALGVKFAIDGWYEPMPLSELTAPPTTMSFQTRENESVEEALERLFLGFQSAFHKLTEPVLPQGKVPDRTIPALERAARWFYLHRVKGESIRSIAISEFGNSDRRKDIHDGIKKAGELFGLTPYTF